MALSDHNQAKKTNAKNSKLKHTDRVTEVGRSTNENAKRQLLVEAEIKAFKNLHASLLKVQPDDLDGLMQVIGQHFWTKIGRAHV